MENNNESFKLLGLSGSDTGSEIAEFVLTPRKKKLKSRRFRENAAPRVETRHRSCVLNARSVACVIAAALLLCWIIVVTWLAVVLHGEVRRLDTSVRAVAAGSQGVPDALQKCHSMSRELQQNQTALYSRLAALTLQIGNFSSQLTLLHSGLHDVEDRLKAAPELVNVPQNIKDLSASVASFGSQIRDLDSTVASLKTLNTGLHDTSDALVQNVTLLQASLGSVLNVTQQPAVQSRENKDENASIRNAMAEMAANITLVNDTLMSKLNWLADDQHKDHVSLELVQNVGQNVTARVTTLEGECAKQTAQAALINTVKKLAENVTNGATQVSDLSWKVNRLVLRSNQVDQPISTPVNSDELLPHSSSLPAVTVDPLPLTPPSSPLPLDDKEKPAPKPPITRP